MPEEKKEETLEATRMVKVVHSGEAPRYYTNNTEIGMTSYDISLKFATIDKADNETLHVRDQAIVTMSLHHAKAVARILTAYVAQFEQNHGPLYSPIVESVDISGDAVAVKVDSNA